MHQHCKAKGTPQQAKLGNTRGFRQPHNQNNSSSNTNRYRNTSNRRYSPNTNYSYSAAVEHHDSNTTYMERPTREALSACAIKGNGPAKRLVSKVDIVQVDTVSLPKEESMHQVKALIDGGSQGNIIDPSFIQARHPG